MNRFVICILMMFSVSCDDLLLHNQPAATLQSKLNTPEELDDGWKVSSPQAEQVDSEAIEQLIRDLQTNSTNIHGLLIARNGKLIAEAYFDGWHRNRLQSMRSATKSVASTLIGIALDNGYIDHTSQSVFDFFPEYEDLRTVQKENIQLQHVLSMTAGLSWEQDAFDVDDPRNDEEQLGNSSDGFRFLLEKKVVAEPGTTFKYNSGCSDLLLGIVDHTTGMTADKFAEDYLFKPLGIQQYGWRKNLNGYPNGAYGLHLLPRDMAKIGQLFLDSGTWATKRVVSAAWIKEATRAHYEVKSDIGYGFQWWIKKNKIGDRIITRYQAQGMGGQIICVIPELNSVVVMAGTNYDNSVSQVPYNILQSRILPALCPN